MKCVAQQTPRSADSSLYYCCFFPCRFQEWFLERYHPKTEESKRDTKLKWVDQESAVFGKQLRANPRQFIASASLDPISEVM